jgi:parallel beta-helix repeat protein
LVLILVLLMFLSSLFCPRFLWSPVRASDGYPVHNLNTGLNYTTIQEAINANETLDGHMIHVDAGIYDSITISKSISLMGEGGNSTIINGSGKLWGVSINANNVTFSGFMVEQGGRGLNIASNGGISIVSNNCRVYDNIIEYSDNYGDGICLDSGYYGASGNVVENNTITNCYAGIWLLANSCKLTNNTVTNCTLLGAFVQGSNNVLRSNIFSDSRFDFGATSIQDIDETNLVNGKPIIYWINQNDRETPENAGYVSCLNCVNITIAGMRAGKVTEGISLVNTTNSVIEDAILSDCENSCIYLFNSSENTILNCSLSGGSDLVQLTYSNSNSIDQSIIEGSLFGVKMQYSEHNVITGNSFENNYEDIDTIYCDATSVCHNNFINSTYAHLVAFKSNLTLDNGFEGNYWSDYNGTDSNQDGIGDTPYVIDANNTDHYPLMGTFQSFNISITPQNLGEVNVISNITISSLDWLVWLTSPNQYLQGGQIFLSLTPVQGQNITAGFCRITLPNRILNTSEYAALVDLTPISVKKLATSNDTYTALYLTFNSSALDGIMIIPEFPTFVLLPLFMIAASLAIMVYKRRHLT